MSSKCKILFGFNKPDDCEYCVHSYSEEDVYEYICKLEEKNK